MDVEVKDSTINSFLIEGFQKNIPLIDIFTLLTKQVDDIKKLTFFHEPMDYISNNCKFQVDFANHESLIKAKLILNAQNLNNLFDSKGQKIKISECQLNKSDLVNETVSKTTALMFENMQINQTNILEFIIYLKHFINSNIENDKTLYKITKVRQYSNRILVIFEPKIPECLKKFIKKGENESVPNPDFFNFKNKNIPIVPKMKPIVNIGKYKEKSIKLSVHNLNEEDRNNLYSIFEKNENDIDDNLMMSKMAETAMNNILNKDKIMREDKLRKNNNLNKKRERIKEKSNEKEKDRRDRDRDRDREPMNRNNRDNNRSRDMKNRIRDRDNRRDNKNREYNNRNMMDDRREDSSSDRDRKRDSNMNLNINKNNNNYRNSGSNMSNINNNNNNELNNNLSGLNINQNDLNQVASLFSNAKAVNLVKLLLENNAFNNMNNPKTNINNNNSMNNNNIKPQMKLNEESNNNKNINYNDAMNNLYNQNPNNINNNVNLQQLLNALQSQNQGNIMNNNNNNKNNQTQQRMNNNNLNNNFQNLMNINQMMGIDNNNNLMNNNYFNNQRQFQYPINEQFMNQFNNFNSPQKRKNNDN